MKITIKTFWYEMQGVRYSFATLPEALRSLCSEPVLSSEENCVRVLSFDIPVGHIIET